MDAWVATAFAIWFAMLAALYWLVKRRVKPTATDAPASTPPASFRSLSPAERRQALDMAWTPGLRTVTALPVRSAVQATYMVVLTVAGVVAAGLAFLLILLVALADDVDRSGAGPVIFLVPIVVFGVAFACLYGAVERRAAVLGARAADAVTAARANRLKELAVVLLRGEASQWVEAMRVSARETALQEAGAVPEHTFTLLSCAASGVGRDDLPPARIGASYIFSNGSVVIVAGVVFDVKATGYSLVGADDPELSINSPERWTSDEFFYRDIVEVNYAPEASTGESIKGKEGELQREGTLTLGLVNGTRKEIPACKTDASGFVTLARDRVRAVRA